MLIARLANKSAKPNGQYFVPDEKIEEFMLRQQVKDLPGNISCITFLILNVLEFNVLYCIIYLSVCLSMHMYACIYVFIYYEL